MRPSFQILLVALAALGWSSLASADSPDLTSSRAPSSFSAINDLSLDNAFEQATSPMSDDSAHALGGPTSMDCKNGATIDGLEVCVVTVDGLLASMPAALAPN